MRVASAIALPIEIRRQLEKQMRGRSTPVRVAQRSRIVLLAADGLQNKQIAAKMGVAPRMAALWRGRFTALGIDGLLKDAPRPGRTPKISAATVSEVIAKTTQSTPANATHWSRSTMARAMNISDSTVGRIWRANGLKPHRVDTFKVSNDPNFADKLEAIVGLYLNPPEHALVLSVDEKSQIQALDRTQPGLPMKKGRCQTMTHDYKRNGTTTLFAALNPANGEVYGLCQQKHRHQEWLKFLRMIDQTVPGEKEIYLICDNYSTHKHERVERWLEAHKRFHVRFTPTSSS
jgi:transposase